ncbi:MAG TPA: DegT/DnrJ/EryC1/StrS family aminotransferase [Opitutaceae bacterium]|nr:DegT/DnrJ/EryC1/StrS family aminotransferase [Opitutaceae bacterium]
MSAKTNVPFLDLRAQHDPIRAELLAAFNEVIDQNAFAGGPFVQKFEEDFAAFCRAKHAIGVGNGTDALWFALLALGVGPGDEVITVSATFMATAEAISYCGATPVFVDIDEATYTMNPALLERAITPRTKAIVPVHLYGQVADMDPILEIAKRHGIPVVEDACQAHGAEYKGRRAGTMGDLGCFSFYPGKNLGALGEAGGVTTQDATLAAKVRTLREHGQEKRYFHSMIGWNGRMDGLQAVALRIKLRSLDKGNASRRANAALYSRLLADVPGVIAPAVAAHGVPVFHLYVVRVKNRDTVLARLGERGIGCGIHYPKPIHLQQAYAHLGLGPGTTPVAERCAEEILSLPMFPELAANQIETVVSELRQVLQQQGLPRVTAA